MITLTKRQSYRSTSDVSITDDMVRVTLTMTRNEWQKLKGENKILERTRGAQKNESLPSLVTGTGPFSIKSIPSVEVRCPHCNWMGLVLSINKVYSAACPVCDEFIVLEL